MYPAGTDLRDRALAADDRRPHVRVEGRQVLRGDLDLDARNELSAEVSAAITSASTAGGVVTLDCAAVECVSAIDTSVIGMLVTLGRTARRNGSRLVLVHAPQPMRAQLEAADVAHFFTWKR